MIGVLATDHAGTRCENGTDLSIVMLQYSLVH